MANNGGNLVLAPNVKFGPAHAFGSMHPDFVFSSGGYVLQLPISFRCHRLKIRTFPSLGGRRVIFRGWRRQYCGVIDDLYAGVVVVCLGFRMRQRRQVGRSIVNHFLICSSWRQPFICNNFVRTTVANLSSTLRSKCRGSLATRKIDVFIGIHQPVTTCRRCVPGPEPAAGATGRRSGGAGEQAFRRHGTEVR